MANPSPVSLHLVAAVAAGVCASQTPGAAGALTINGSLATGGVATFDVARRVAVASTANDATVVFTIYGTNGSGAAISNTVTGVNAGSVNSLLDFLTVTKVTSSAGTAGAITVGTSSTASTPWIVDNFMAPYWALAVAVSVAGTVTYTVEHTYDDPNATVGNLTTGANSALGPASNIPPIAWPNPTLAAQTASGEAQYVDKPIFAHRLTITAGTGTATMQSIQAGIGSP